jgi:hypothetical protein
MRRVELIALQTLTHRKSGDSLAHTDRAGWVARASATPLRLTITPEVRGCIKLSLITV